MWLRFGLFYQCFPMRQTRILKNILGHVAYVLEGMKQLFLR